MNQKEKILFHQVHPAKLATDIVSAIVSLYFFWQHELLIGLITHFVPPPVGSFLVIRFMVVAFAMTNAAHRGSAVLIRTLLYAD